MSCVTQRARTINLYIIMLYPPTVPIIPAHLHPTRLSSPLSLSLSHIHTHTHIYSFLALLNADMAASVEAASWASSMSKKGGWEEVEDSQLMLELMLGSVDRSTSNNTLSTAPDSQLETLDLLGSASASVSCINTADCSSSSLPLAASDALDLSAPLPPGWQKCLDLQTGRVYYLENSGSSSAFSIPSKRLSDVFVPCLSFSCADKHPDLETQMKQAMSTSTTQAAKRVCSPEGGKAPCRTTTNATVFGVDLSSPPQQVESTPVRASLAAYMCTHDSGNGTAVGEMTTVGCANCLMFVMLSMSDPRCPNCGSCAVLDFTQPPMAKRAKQT